MNQKSEQLTACYNIVLDDDQPLTPRGISEIVMNCLGDRGSYVEICGKKVLVYKGAAQPIILLCKCITYLGNPHPVFKKRIQIPGSWLEYTNKVKEQGYDVRFIGVYHYNGFVVFADFKKDTYLKRMCNNSAAHVYINDLYQGATNDVFSKHDKNGNEITCISIHRFADYLNGWRTDNKLVKLFAEFNYGYDFGQWITAIEAISEMHNKHWSQWKQAEWAGWFLEYRFSEWSKLPDVSPHIQYTALKNKSHKEDEFDFDLWFPIHEFHGDLKASDIMHKETPGNDQKTFLECINKYGKFWYIVYEHETIKDRDREYEATKWRNTFIWENEEKHTKAFDELSYHRKMKNSVKFVKMFILELNRINFHEALSDFNQGHQPDGSPRKPKFKIDKKNIDNYIIYRYNYSDGKE